MAEPGTFIGEIQRGWQRFWRLSWWWKGPILGVAALIVLGGIRNAAGGGGDDKPSVQVQQTTPAAAAGTQTRVPTVTAAPNTPSSAPTEVAPLSLEERVQKSYEDNKDFIFRASDEGLAIRWLPDQGGQLELEILPTDVLTNGDWLTVTANSALVASKAVWTTYSEVQEIRFITYVEATDQYGAKSRDVAAEITVLRATGELFQYDGLKDLVVDDNKHLFCIADHYQIGLSIYRDLEDKGCLTEWGFTK